MTTTLDLMEYADDPAAQVYITNGHHAVTFHNTAQLDTADKKWGAASLLLDGDSDYLSLADHADWDISVDFTIDFFVNHDATGSNERYMSHYELATEQWLFQKGSTETIVFKIVSGGATIVNCLTAAAIIGTGWTHVAVCKVGNEYGIYVDGVQKAYVSDADMDTFAGSLYIGSTGDPTNYVDGHMDEIRIQHSNIFGAAPNATPDDTITVPTAPHQADTNTKLLLHLDGANAAQATVDWSRLESRSDDTIEQQGTYCLEGFAKQTDSLNDTLTRTIGAPIDLSGLSEIKLDIRASRTGSNIKIGIHDDGGTTTEHTANVAQANTWQTETWDISGVADANKNAIDSIIITIVNADNADNTFNIDNMYAQSIAANAIFFGTNF